METILLSIYPDEGEAEILNAYEGSLDDLGPGERAMAMLARYPMMKKRMSAIGLAVEREANDGADLSGRLAV